MVSRRRTLQSFAGLFAGTALVGCGERTAREPTAPEGVATTVGPAATTTAAGVFADHLGRVPNYDGTLRDWRGNATVQVRVGVELGYGPFGFGPPAIQVDPGTTVEWRWTGEGGDHNVVAADGTFDSGGLVADAGVHFSYTFDRTGTYDYYCEPHRTSEMKGGVLVGPVPESATTDPATTGTDDA